MLTPEYIYAVREAYAGGLDPAQPELSPLLADFSGFPPTLIQVGTHEILFSDAERLAVVVDRAHEPGADLRRAEREAAWPQARWWQAYGDAQLDAWMTQASSWASP